MTRINDEVIVAMLDGALSLEERFVTERQLSSDPSSLRALRLMRLSGLSIRAAFSGPEFDDIPDRLRRVIDGQCLRRPDRTSPGRSWFRTPRVQPASAVCVVAAATVAVAGLLSQGYAPQDFARIPLGEIDRASNLARVLEAHDNDIIRPASAASSEMTVVASANDRQGRTCRAVEVEPGSGRAGQQAVIACRSQSGSWTVVATATMAAGQSPEPTGAESVLSWALGNAGAGFPLGVTQDNTREVEKVER